MNLVERVVEVHRQPLEGRYASRTLHGEHALIAPAAFPEVVIDVQSLLP